MLKIRNLLLSIMYNKKLNFMWRPAKNLFQWIDNKTQGETSETESKPVIDISESQCIFDELD